MDDSSAVDSTAVLDDPPPPTTVAGRQAAAEAENQHEVATAREEEDFIYGPFDAQKAVDDIFRLNRDVANTFKDWDYAKKKAAEAKGRYDDAVEALSARITELEAWEHGKDGDQPRLRTLSEEDRAAETIDDRRARLSEQLHAKDLLIGVTQLEVLDRTELDAVEHWLSLPPGNDPPEALVRAIQTPSTGSPLTCQPHGMASAVPGRWTTLPYQRADMKHQRLDGINQ